MRRLPRPKDEFLANLDFDELVAFAEEEYNKQRQGQAALRTQRPVRRSRPGAEPDIRFYAVELDPRLPDRL